MPDATKLNTKENTDLLFRCASHSEVNKVFVVMKNHRHYHVYLDTMVDNAVHVREHVAEFFTEGAAKHLLTGWLQIKIYGF